MIIHQKLSARMAQHDFDVQDKAVLSAIGCHTTLKPGASVLDKVVFWPTKLRGINPASRRICKTFLAALDGSLDGAALCYLDFLWEQHAAAALCASLVCGRAETS